VVEDVLIVAVRCGCSTLFRYDCGACSASLYRSVPAYYRAVYRTHYLLPLVTATHRSPAPDYLRRDTAPPAVIPHPFWNTCYDKYHLPDPATCLCVDDTPPPAPPAYRWADCHLPAIPNFGHYHFYHVTCLPILCRTTYRYLTLHTHYDLVTFSVHLPAVQYCHSMQVGHATAYTCLPGTAIPAGSGFVLLPGTTPYLVLPALLRLSFHCSRLLPHYRHLRYYLPYATFHPFRSLVTCLPYCSCLPVTSTLFTGLHHGFYRYAPTCREHYTVTAAMLRCISITCLPEHLPVPARITFCRTITYGVRCFATPILPAGCAHRLPASALPAVVAFFWVPYGVQTPILPYGLPAFRAATCCHFFSAIGSHQVLWCTTATCSPPPSLCGPPPLRCRFLRYPDSTVPQPHLRCIRCHLPHLPFITATPGTVHTLPYLIPTRFTSPHLGTCCLVLPATLFCVPCRRLRSGSPTAAPLRSAVPADILCRAWYRAVSTRSALPPARLNCLPVSVGGITLHSDFHIPYPFRRYLPDGITRSTRKTSPPACSLTTLRTTSLLIGCYNLRIYRCLRITGGRTRWDYAPLYLLPRYRPHTCAPHYRLHCAGTVTHRGFLDAVRVTGRAHAPHLPYLPHRALHNR